ncbi:MAG: hypothetical protein KC546_00800 [Anaerolineae bacterium]|nr:hypothetical protein [Anaerolineae bacterium]MCA9893500.1 hypothetical protein [Anaerolineae bacterium]
MRKAVMLLVMIALFAIAATPTFAGERFACDITITGAVAQTNYVEVSWNASGDCSGDFWVYIEAFNYDSYYSPGEEEPLGDSIVPQGYICYWICRYIYDGPYSGVVGANTFSMPIDPALTSEFDWMYYEVYDDGESGYDSLEIPVSGSGASGNTCGNDGRVNAADCARDTWALYVTPEGDGFTIQVWDTLLEHSVIFVFADEIAELPAFPEQNMVIATSADGRMVLSKLTTGEYQLNVLEPDGKMSVIVFTLPLTESYRLDSESGN